MPQSEPLVTVIMPVRNAARSISDSLGAVFDQTWPHFEVLVVDGMSTDATREQIATLVATRNPPLDIRVIDNPQRIVPTGLNLGIAAARGAYIARVDGHCRIAPNHIRRCVETQRVTGADNVGGIVIGTGDTALARAIAAAQASRFGVGGARFRSPDATAGPADTVFPGFWPRDVFARVGGFDEELVRNQDDEHNLRLQQAGGLIWLDPAIRTEYANRASLAGLWAQYFGYGFYKVRVAQKCGGVASLRHLAPAAFVAALSASLIAGLTIHPMLAAAVFAPYLIANIVAAASAARGRITLAALLPLAFAVLHLAYGCGFLLGVWRFRKHGLPPLRKARPRSREALHAGIE